MVAPLAHSFTFHAAIPVPAFVIMMEAKSRCLQMQRQLADLVPRLTCLSATRRSEVNIWVNGTARLNEGVRVIYHFPYVHHKVFAFRELEVAILVSHLRAIAAGRASGASAFVVFEEDAEWSLLHSSPHDTVAMLLDSMPRHWSVLQAAVIAESQYLKHLAKRLESARSRAGLMASHRAPPPIVARDSLRGLSWPFTPGREVVENATWLRPYWSAAAYVYSGRGADVSDGNARHLHASDSYLLASMTFNPAHGVGQPASIITYGMPCDGRLCFAAIGRNGRPSTLTP